MSSRPLTAALLLSFAAFPAAAQVVPGDKPTEGQIQAGEAPITPMPEGEIAVRGLPAGVAAPKWTKQAARDLLAFVERTGEDGLDPANYTPDRLREAIDKDDEAALNLAASDVFLKVSADLALGHVRSDARIDWHTRDPDLDANQQFSLMHRAISGNSVGETLTSLLPSHPQYAELKTVLAQVTDRSARDKIRLNLERWRWLPRDLGSRYVIVNVPAFTVALVENGQVVARHRAVVGAAKTATPQLSAVATGVIFNPWWEVPRSIAPEVRGKRGYVTVPDGKGVRYRQPPGPGNALGRVKVVMPNNYAIYLHDTPSKALFARPVRAASHGCIRTQNALGFAELLLGNPEWDKAAIDRTIASGKTVQAQAITPTPVYVAYFTAAAAAGTTELVSYRDVYGRDAPILAQLNNSQGDTNIPASATAAAPRPRGTR
ncbi:MAG: L,D-transpeptidase family protein [Allosphingosinicella sp.]